MPPSVLLSKLIDIQRSIGIETDNVIRNKLMDAQNYLLLMEKERVRAFGTALEPCGIRNLFAHIYSHIHDRRARFYRFS